MAYSVKNKLQFLSEASKILSSSLDYNVTLTSIASLIVKNIADFCIIDLLNADGTTSRVAVRVGDSKYQKLAKEMFNYPPDSRNKHGIYDAIRTGEPILIEKVTRNWVKGSSKIPGEQKIVWMLKMNSFMFVPLKSRGKIIGVLTAASSTKDFSYSKEDLLLAEELSDRAGIAVDKARLFSEAQDAIRARDEFLSIASHELKTPLTSIILHVQTVLRNIRKKSKEKGTEEIVSMLESTEQQSRRLSKLISDLLNVSLVSTGRLQLEKEKVDLSALAKELCIRFGMQASKPKTKLKLKAKHSVVGLWDKVRLEQVISNLLSNAIKYGGKKPIIMEVKKEKNQAVFTIKDKGIGIKQEHQKIIFERFKRGVSAKDYRGLGVGLYIARQIVEMHKGIIGLESRAGEGSTFTIRLPLK